MFYIEVTKTDSKAVPFITLTLTSSNFKRNYFKVFLFFIFYILNVFGFQNP